MTVHSPKMRQNLTDGTTTQPFMIGYNYHRQTYASGVLHKQKLSAMGKTLQNRPCHFAKSLKTGQTQWQT